MMTREEYLKSMPSHFKLRSADREAYLKSMPSHFKLRSVDQSRDESSFVDFGKSKLALAAGGLEGATLGWADEALAAAASPFVGAYQWATDPNAQFGLSTLARGYSTAHDWLNEQQRELARQYPWEYYGGSIAGSIAPMFYTGGLSSPAILANTARIAYGIPKAGATIPQLMALGGISGAVQGFGSGSGLENRVQGALRGGTIGAGLGGIFGGIGGRLGATGANAPLTPNVTDIPTEAYKRYGRELYEAGVPTTPGGLAEAAKEASGEGGRIIGIPSGANKALETAAKEQRVVNDLFQNALEDVKKYEVQNVVRSIDTHLPSFNTIQPRYSRTAQGFVEEVKNRYEVPAAEIFDQLKYRYVDEKARKSLNDILMREGIPDEVLGLFFDQYKRHKGDAFAVANRPDTADFNIRRDVDMRRAQYLDDGVSEGDITVALATKQLPSNIRLDFELLHRFQNELDDLAQQFKGKTGYQSLKSIRDDIKNFINKQTTGNLYPSSSIGNRVAVSSYTDAMSAYRLSKTSQSAVESGRNAVSDTVENVRKSWYGLDDPLEKEAYRVGLRQELFDRIIKSDSPTVAMNELLQTPAMQSKLFTVFDDIDLAGFKKDIAQQTRNVLSIPKGKYSGAPTAEKSLFRKIASSPLSIVGHILDSLRDNWQNPKIMAEGLAQLSLLKPGDISNEKAVELLQAYIRAAERGHIKQEQFQRAFFEISKLLTKADVISLQKSGVTEKGAAELRQKYGVE